ncbi:ATP-dependent helicase Lhr and Lhr-like helicase [Solimonas aquatica]|uniref:ATP-dependent helicase Lhr and Lhr-like helicase n=1 Tax=Solimonas aquatica TaxID=489703 RepID=A0A1H9LRB5_9GAMM|nr:DEAD/DEAH box helicase [Solimonas aquatica]SER14031.1 ATP-dependent helicase Lhr and Lhr-like helicase [Solimonas aquatica]
MQQHLPFADCVNDSPLGAPFHPAVADWFTAAFGTPTEVQRQTWAYAAQQRDVLATAPTGSGKTLAAFLAAINALVIEGLDGPLPDAVQVLYVSPLKALSNDIQKNLEAPLAGIAAQLRARHLPPVDIRSAVRTGDTSTLERERMRRAPPHILVTTPESLYILLSSDSGRQMLRSVRSVIVDELHAVAVNKRGAHLALSLQRLDALCQRPPTRIGLSATQKPISRMAEALLGARSADCAIVDTGHKRQRDLGLELPRAPLTAVMATEVWGEIYDRLAELVSAHRTTLIFVNQRRVAERVAHHLAERIGEAHVTAHHGSLAREHRFDAEQRLKSGQLKALVATASLELGIDIGEVDLVCQLGSPRGINAFLQRVGRAGHAVRALPKGRLFPLSLDDLLECTALMDAVAQEELDHAVLPQAPLDVLAQQIVAEVACQDWPLAELHARMRAAQPYRELSLERFEQLVQMLADGYATKRGRRGALLHYDAVHRMLRARRGAKLVAVSNAGTIPDQFDSEVELVPEGVRIGTLNEDFAFESLPGDIVQLGNTSYRILKIETGRVIVEDAKGQPPNMPFWFGEAPGRSDELSIAVSRLRARAEALLDEGVEALRSWLQDKHQLPTAAAEQLAQYLAAAKAALGLLPTRERIVFERFFDEVGDTHLVIHAPLGSRIMRAWGLALRKRFCRQFNFELQAAALDDSLVLSLGPTHSFPLEDVTRYLHSNSALDALIQAVLQAPMFNTRWRWVASVALAVERNRKGKRVPPQFQRSDAEDLLTHAFPDALACQDNLTGDREVPDHPLVQQALDDCLHEVMDADGFLALLKRLESGATQVICRDLTTPSPLSESILNARPYAFLDDGAAEERRTLAVKTRGLDYLKDIEPGRDLARLDREAIASVREEMRPEPANAEEVHDALVTHGFFTEDEASGWTTQLQELMQQRRVARLSPSPPAARGERAGVRGAPEAASTPAPLWVAAERLRELRAVLPEAALEGDAPLLGKDIDADSALRELLRSRLELQGPVTAAELATPLGLPANLIDAALLALEQQGSAMRGHFEALPELQWCERRRLARIHRYTRDRKRAQYEPVPPAAFMRFLLHWQGVVGEERREGPVALEAVLAQLEGFPAAAAAWEAELLPARLRWYEPHWLDQLCATGRVFWQRLPSGDNSRKNAPVRATPIVLLARERAACWQSAPDAAPELSASAQDVLSALRAQGASFFVDLVSDTGRLRSEVEGALGELVSHGLVNADGFAGLRALIAPAEIKARRLRRGGLRAAFENLEGAGRWSLVRQRRSEEEQPEALRIETIARSLLKRYGVLFRKLLEREPQLPPWRELAYVLRRLEARGEIAGGRFVSLFAGEQFALPEAATALRRFREDRDEALAVVCGSDPLNLLGLILPGERVPALPGNRILYRGGIAVATLIAGEVNYLQPAEAAQQHEWKQKLLRRTGD